MGPDELRSVARDIGAARRVVTTEAAPRVIVEGIYGIVSAVGALSSSAPLAVYFVAHEGLISQVVGFAGAMLAQRRDGYMAQAETAREVGSSGVQRPFLSRLLIL
jgi:ketopantoate hydroxymethyltransferase